VCGWRRSGLGHIMLIGFRTSSKMAFGESAVIIDLIVVHSFFMWYLSIVFIIRPLLEMCEISILSSIDCNVC
jgi:hypothetical protein